MSGVRPASPTSPQHDLTALLHTSAPTAVKMRDTSQFCETLKVYQWEVLADGVIGNDDEQQPGFLSHQAQFTQLKRSNESLKGSSIPSCHLRPCARTPASPQ